MGGGALHDDPLQAAQRELREETGLSRDAMAGNYALIYFQIGDRRRGRGVRRARFNCWGENRLEHSEADLEVLRLPLSEAIQWVLDGKITDVISCAGLLKLHALNALDKP